VPPVPTATRPTAPIGIGAPPARAALPSGAAAAAPVATAGPGAPEPAALTAVVGEPCSCGHTIAVSAADAALLLALARGLTATAAARQLGLKKKQASDGIKRLRTTLGAQRIPQLVDLAIRWRLLDPGMVAPIRPARPSRDLKSTELGALANAAAGSSVDASAEDLVISIGRVHKVLAAVRDVLLARDTAHAVALGHRLHLLPDAHPHLAAHASTDHTTEAGVA